MYLSGLRIKEYPKSIDTSSFRECDTFHVGAHAFSVVKNAEGLGVPQVALEVDVGLPFADEWLQ